MSNRIDCLDFSGRGIPGYLPGMSGGTGFVSETDLASMLKKALSVGSGVDTAVFTGGRSLVPEDLEDVLTRLLFENEEARLATGLKRSPANGPVHQWNVWDSSGTIDGMYTAEGGAPPMSSSNIQRRYLTHSYVASRREVTHQMTMTNLAGGIDPIALETEAGTRLVIQAMENMFLYGDRDISPYESDGLTKLIPASNTYDMRGKTASHNDFQTALYNGAKKVRTNKGSLDTILGNPEPVYTFSDAFMKTQYRLNVPQGAAESTRHNMGIPGADNAVGGVTGNAYLAALVTPNGSMYLQDDVYCTVGGLPTPSPFSVATPTRPVLTPSTPTLSGYAHTAESGSLFAEADAGDYIYRVEAANNYGAGAASDELIAASVAAGEKVTFTITPGSTAPTEYRVYRSKKGASSGSDVRFLTRIKNTADPITNPITFTDKNFDLPGTTDVFQLSTYPQKGALDIIQFAPFGRFPLYSSDAMVILFVLYWYGALLMRKPLQHIRLKNVGTSTSSGGWY